MKTRINLVILLFKMVILLTIGMLSSCEEAYVEPYETFVIPAGKHNKGFKVESLQAETLAFTAIFDESARYDTNDPVNQHDINKLMGFSDCNAHHHANSARFGWRWLDENLEIHAYVYNNGERQTEKIGTIEIGQPAEFQLTLLSNNYLFTVNGYKPVEIDRNSKCEIGLYYMLYPYFGGDEVAPHDISIQIKRNY